MSKIFLSHTSTDKPFVRKLAGDLRRYGHTVWIDEAEINIGDSLIGKIRKGLDEVDFVAVVLSKASVKSQWVQKEIEIASNREIEEKKVLVLPLIIENVELPGFLKGKLYGDFSKEEEYQEKLSLLLRSLGDSTLIVKTESDELVKLKEELTAAREIAASYKEKADKIKKYSLFSKSEKLKEAIEDENENHPEYTPINSVYAFEIEDISITLGSVLWAIMKVRRYGAHQLEHLLTITDNWDKVDRMLEAYEDLLNSEKLKESI